MPFTPYQKENTGEYKPFADTLIEKYQQEPQPQEKSLLRSIVEEPIKQLLVKPAARTAEAIGRTGVLGENIQRGYEQMADTGQTIGGINIEPVTSGKQVAGEALQVASYLFPYGKAANVAGKTLGAIGGNVASGAAGGYLADVGYGLADKNKTTTEALTSGLGTAIGATVPLVGSVVRGAGRGIAKIGEKTVDVVIPASTREAQILQTYKANNPFIQRVTDVLKGTSKSPTTAGKTVTTEALMGTKSQIGIQAKRASQSLWEDIISPRLKASDYAVDLDGFFNKVEKDIIESTPEIARQKTLLKALDSFREDYAGTKAISLEKLQKLKEGWAEFIPEKAYRGENISGAANQVRKLLADESRQTIYSQLGGDVKQAYLDYGNLQGIQKMGVVSMTGQKLKGGTGGFVSELFSQAVTPIGTVGGQAIYQLGKGIEFIGNLGAKNLGEALGVNLKFPGDKAVDDISNTIKKVKSLPNKEGGFIKLNQETNLPTAKQATQAITNDSNTVISPKSTTKTTPKSSEISLINEAKKYKSAEEFVKAYGQKTFSGASDITKEWRNEKMSGFDTIFRGRNELGGGIYITDSPEYAKTFGDKITESSLKNNLKLFDVRESSGEIGTSKLNKIKSGFGDGYSYDYYLKNGGEDLLPTDYPDEILNKIQKVYGGNSTNILKRAGFDGIIANESRIGGQGGTVWNIFDAKNLKTKSQLTDIWNKANKK